MMDHSVLAAIARFPDRASAIRERAETDDGFRSLCTDLEEAEAALGHWEQSSSPVREARTTEYRDLVRELVAELEATLDRNR